MSAGQSLRRGYYGVTTIHRAETSRSNSHAGAAIVTGTLVVVIAAIASDPVLSSYFGRALYAIYADAVRVFMFVVSRGAV